MVSMRRLGFPHRVAATWLTLALASTAFAQPSPQPSETPYVRLFTLIPGGSLEEEVTEENLRFIARNYGWINSHGGAWLAGSAHSTEIFFGPSGVRDHAGRTVGERLRELNPSIILTNYRNGAYTSQDALTEAAEVERDLPLAIAVHDTGARLAAPIDAQQTTLRLTAPASRPANQPPVYPFKASTTAEAYTRNKTDYVTWLRLGDEVLRIDRVDTDGGEIVLTVRRGNWNTEPAAHTADTRVFQPVYCGAIRPNGEEYYLSGLLDGNSPQPAVRYIMQQQHPAFWKFLARHTANLLAEGVHPWFDCSTSSWINHANAYGVRVEAFDFESGEPLTRERLREYQQRKFDFIQERFPQAEIYVNWIFPQHWFRNGYERYQLTGENGHRPVAGAALEMYANFRYMPWDELIRVQIDQRDLGLRIVSWAKESGVGNDDSRMASDYLLFAYGTYLLVHEPGAENYFGASWRNPHRTGRFIPPEFVYWDFGAPKQKFATLEEAAHPEHPGVYRRLFERGEVLVNPDAEATREIVLAAPAFNASERQWVERVTLRPRTAALLLRHHPTEPDTAH
mgnify:CR=1 FL=1